MDRIFSFFEELFRTPTPVCDECGTETMWIHTLYNGTGVRHECVECHGDAERFK